jgi:hypothetical protein
MAISVELTAIGAVLVTSGFGLATLTILYQAIFPKETLRLTKIFVACALLTIAGCACGLLGSPWLR